MTGLLRFTLRTRHEKDYRALARNPNRLRPAAVRETLPDGTFGAEADSVQGLRRPGIDSWPLFSFSQQLAEHMREDSAGTELVKFHRRVYPHEAGNVEH